MCYDDQYCPCSHRTKLIAVHCLREGANKVFFLKNVCCQFQLTVTRSSVLTQLKAESRKGAKTTDRKGEQKQCLFLLLMVCIIKSCLRILFLILAWLWRLQWNTVYRNDFCVEILRLFTLGMDMYNGIKFTAGAQGDFCFFSVPRLLPFNCNDDLIFKYKY